MRVAEAQTVTLSDGSEGRPNPGKNVLADARRTRRPGEDGTGVRPDGGRRLGQGGGDAGGRHPRREDQGLHAGLAPLLAEHPGEQRRRDCHRERDGGHQAGELPGRAAHQRLEVAAFVV